MEGVIFPSENWLSRKALSGLPQGQALLGSRPAVKSRLTTRQSLVHLNIWVAASPSCSACHLGECSFRAGRADLLRKHEWSMILILCPWAPVCLLFLSLFQASDLGQVGLDLEAEFEKGLKELLICHEASENSFQARPWSCSAWTKSSQFQDLYNGTLAILRLPTTLGCYWVPSSFKSRLHRIITSSTSFYSFCISLPHPNLIVS